ncbi:hypothetical protein [Rhizobium tubonense]|uniref:Uncharacterized protein n=1 Tax=Rhizobium tubonense TaxID=484088 RepID=A0A2W4CUS2_9HYPH|nr:hypothetical protein [Rhizobium tubonense]PZM16099.1 hypothetical protein CPY51_05320 [Rhizobium tubonense]
MPKSGKDNLFNPEKIAKREKAAADNPPFRAIASEEMAARLKKTAHLKELRLQKEAEEALLEPAQKTKAAPAKRATKR